MYNKCNLTQSHNVPLWLFISNSRWNDYKILIKNLLYKLNCVLNHSVHPLVSDVPALWPSRHSIKQRAQKSLWADTPSCALAVDLITHKHIQSSANAHTRTVYPGDTVQRLLSYHSLTKINNVTAAAAAAAATKAEEKVSWDLLHVTDTGCIAVRLRSWNQIRKKFRGCSS